MQARSTDSRSPRATSWHEGLYDRRDLAEAKAALGATGAGNASIDVAAGVAEDAAGNPNTAATQVVVANTIVSDTQKIIETFISERAGLIVQSQPDLVDRLTRGGGNPGEPLGYFANGTPDNYTMGFATSLEQISTPALDEVLRVAPLSDGASGADDALFDIWIDGKWAHADGGTTATDFGVLHLGADYLLNPDLAVGVMGQVDWTSQRGAIAGTGADGLGWMVGPYAVARLNEHLYLDASVLGGQSTNEVDPLGTYTDTFETDRWLAKAQLTGEFELGELTFSPILAGSYFGETQKAYTDNLGNVIPSQTIGLGNVSFGPRVSYLVEGEGIDIEPSAGLVGSWEHRIDASGDVSTALSARLESGLGLRLEGGAALNVNAFYAGIGVVEHDAYGVSGRLRVPLN